MALVQSVWCTVGAIGSVFFLYLHLNVDHLFISVCLQETLRHLSKFVRGSVTERSGCAGELVKSALQLLQSLPATRSAVLQYITDIYDEAVNQHLEQRKLAFCSYILVLFITCVIYYE